MSDTYYWRRRNQVQGPFDMATMQRFYDSGSLSTTHEISTDGTTWVLASELIGKWDHGGGGGGGGAGGRTRGGGGGGGEDEEDELKLAEDGWHFEDEGNPKGPIPFSQLQQLFATGRLKPETRVWNETMEDWKRASTFPELTTQPNTSSSLGGTGSGSGGTGTGSGEETPPEQSPNPQIVAALGRSRPWATFLAVVSLIGGVLGVIAGLVVFIRGAKFENAVLVGQGIGYIIGSSTTITLAIILLSFSSLANTAQIQKTDKTLIDALHGLRRYFLIQGMVVLLMLSMVLLLVIMQAALT